MTFDIFRIKEKKRASRENEQKKECEDENRVVGVDNDVYKYLQM